MSCDAPACCCAQPAPPPPPWVSGEMRTPVGPVPRVRTELAGADRWGAIRVRFSIGRMRYSIAPGLYAVGHATRDSLVFVTANYKLSFDRLREQLASLDAWILVLDTRGINVWCAAGKGTFGTGELTHRINATGLDRVVSHRQVVLPQLGASGVAAHEVRKLTGFRVIYGPVRATDIPAFVAAGLRATREMRRVRFRIRDRMVLVPVEIAGWGRYLILTLLLLLLLGGLHRGGYDIGHLLSRGVRAAGLTLTGYLGAGILTPLLLPWLPGRAFAAKGALLGVLMALALLALGWIPVGGASATLEASAWFLLIPAVSAFVAMNFTGATTFTSQSGVKREMRFAIPAQIAAAVLGLVLWAASAVVT